MGRASTFTALWRDKEPQIVVSDFSNWKNHGTFEAAFTKLEKDLRASTL
jgi:hypothetical protein